MPTRKRSATPKRRAKTRRKYRTGAIRQRNYQKIIEAAEEEFVRHGYRGTSIQSIARRADLPKANVHYYFRNKDTLYRAVLDNILHLWNAFLDDITVADEPRVVLAEFIRKKMELSYRRPSASKLFAMEIIQGAPHLGQYLRTDMRRWLNAKTKVMSVWMRRGKMAKTDPTLLIFLIWAATQHYADFDAQVLPLLKRRAYHDAIVAHVSDFLTRVILTGVGVR